MAPIEFEDPPRAHPGVPSPITDDDRATLIEHTRRWAVVHTTGIQNANKLARAIRESQGVWAGHTWEATVRRNPDRKTAKVYARHITPAQE